MRTKDAIASLKPYNPPKTRPSIKLDANESDNFLFDAPLSFEDVPLNLYPDSNATALRQSISQVHTLPAENIIVGAGSSELIELTIKTYMNPGDRVLAMTPTFGMYEVYTTMHGGVFDAVAVDENHDLPVDEFIARADATNPALIILCSPNNPTGKRIAEEAIRKIVTRTKAPVLVDEAYIDFSGEDASLKHAIHEYSNLLITRTFSKAYGMAGARLGYMFAPEKVISTLNRVKTPYSVNAITQTLGIKALNATPRVNEYCKGVAERRETLKKALEQLGYTITPSEANFLYVTTDDATLGDKLSEKGIAIRAYGDNAPAHYRISVGNTQDNDALIRALKEVNS